MEVLLRVIWRSVFSKPAPKDFSFTFTPLWQMSAMDKANIGKTNTETVLGAYEGGLVDRATGMKELRQTSGDSGIFSNISDDAIDEAENEEPPMPDETPIGEEPKPDDKPVEKPEEKQDEPVKNLDEKPKTKFIDWMRKK